MPTVIDSLVLEFGLDATQFNRAQRDMLANLQKLEDQSKRGATDIEANVKKTFDLFANLKREALTAIGIFFGGREVGEFVQHITNLDAATGRLATTLGMSAEETSAWQGAIKASGGSAEGASAALSGLSAEMSRFQLTGQSTMLPVLSRLGISLYDQNHQLKTAGELWLELADAVKGMNSREATAFLSMIPGATQDMINFALRGREAMQGMLDKQREIGTATAQSVAEAKEYQEATRNLETAWDSFGRTIITRVAPALSSVLTTMSQILSKHPAGPQTGEDAAFLAALTEAGETGSAAPSGTSPLAEARKLLADKLRHYAGPNTGNSNWDRFLWGLSYLETTHHDTGNARSSAQGYFQFLKGTSQKARSAGLQDPASGSYNDQASATMAYIRHFYPDAAKLIDQGQYEKAIPMLRGEWPSLPGGSQPQTMARYSTFGSILSGSASGPNSTTINVGGITVNSSAPSMTGVGNDIEPALRRSITAASANSGPQ